MTQLINPTILIVGLGKMGGALVNGWLAQDVDSKKVLKDKNKAEKNPPKKVNVKKTSIKKAKKKSPVKKVSKK